MKTKLILKYTLLFVLAITLFYIGFFTANFMVKGNFINSVDNIAIKYSIVFIISLVLFGMILMKELRRKNHC